MEKDHGRIETRRYCLSSLEADIETFARAVRGHWRLENQPDWVLDVQMGEDQSRARNGELGNPSALELESAQTRQSPEVRYQEQTTQRCLGSFHTCSSFSLFGSVCPDRQSIG